MMPDVVLGGFMRMMRCMNAMRMSGMSMSGMGMMPGFLVMAGGVMLGGFLVVMRRVLVMLRCGLVMFFVPVLAHRYGSLVLG
jgi:hypothetical protein